VSGRVRCTNGQGQAPHMGANGTNMAFLIIFTLTGRREEFPARGAGPPPTSIRAYGMGAVAVTMVAAGVLWLVAAATAASGLPSS